MIHSSPCRPPLDRLYKKDTVWKWDLEHQRAFEGIKSVIGWLPVLAYFDAKSEHTTQCDASRCSTATRRKASDVHFKDTYRN